MTRFIRLWNSQQEGSSHFRCPCKNLIRIQLIAINLSWLVYFASPIEDELRRKTDAICITMRSPANFQSRDENGAFVVKSIFSLWTLACQTNVISYAICTKSVTKWFYRRIEFKANQGFSCRDDVLEIAGPIIYDLVVSTDSTGARVNTCRFGFWKTEERSCCCRFDLSPSL